LNWQANYFNYYTEIEEHFQRARGTSLFLLSTLDWALIESWKTSEVPLEAVLRGIDQAFEKWRSRKSKVRMINSLAFCTQAVLEEARVMAGAGSSRRSGPVPPPLPVEDVRAYLSQNALLLREAGWEETARSLGELAASSDERLANLEELEQRLTALEEKLIAALKTARTEEALFEARRDLALQLRPYRGRMTADQLAMLETQYLERRLFEEARLPRLSLFYMR
jgi:hypothetical protein